MDYSRLWFTPPAPDQVPVDLLAPEACPLHGLFRQTWKVGDTDRSIITYIPEGFCQNNRAVIVAPPSDTEPDSFLASSGLGELADRDKLLIAMLEPLAGRWDLSGKDAAFMNAAYKKVQGREYYVVMQDCIYAMGFGDGVDVALEAARTMASDWSGLAVFGDPTIASVQFSAQSHAETDAGSQKEEMYISGKRAQLPVWLLIEQETAVSEQLLAYWEKENHAQPQPLYDEKKTAIFLPAAVKDTSKINEDDIAQTRLTTGFRLQDLNFDTLSYVWAYIGSARRHRSYGNKILRYFRNPLEHGATYHTLIVDGMKREWYEYVPKKVQQKGEPVPLVCVFHGRGGNGETFFDITEMSVVAEERGFIAVFPTADLYQIRKGGFRGVRLWNGSQNGRPFDSLPFVRKMIADVESRLPVDKGRIYACGQSSGGFMSSYCAMAASDLFTAVTPWSGFSLPDDPDAGDFTYRRETAFEDGKVPMMLLVGKEDRFFGASAAWPLDEHNLLHRFIRYIIRTYELQEEPLQYTCYPIDYYVWHNGSAVPMFVIGLVNDMPHANYPEESWISYDQFLCRYSRDETGARCYLGRKIE